MKPLVVGLSTTALAALFLLPAWSHPQDPLSPAGHWTGNSRGGARTPPMGWNSWNAFGTDVDENKVIGAAQILLDTRLASLGYVYVNLDDGWWLKRRASDGRLQVRIAIFPSAATGGPDETSFKPFTDKLHAMGLKAGIYTDIGRNACSQAYDLHSPNLPQGTTAEREVGLDAHVEQDLRLYFKDWGFDYIKIDACGLADFVPGSDLVKQQGYRAMPPLIERSSINRTDIPEVRARYQAVAAELGILEPNGDYVLSICNWGTADVRTWGKDTGNLWRTSSDITPSWSSMLHNFDSAAKRALYAGPGHWNDPDILDIGHADFDDGHLVEARSHFSLWAMIGAPLLISYDLRQSPKSLLEVLSNADLIRIDQDEAGNQGVVVFDSDEVQIIVKTLSRGAPKAVALFNRGATPAGITLLAEHLKFAMDSPVLLRDLWSKETQTFSGERTFTLAPHETRVFAATGRRQLENGVFLSEIPGSINIAVDGTRHPQLDPTIHRMIDPWSNTRAGSSQPQYAGWGGAQADSTPFGQTLEIAGHAYRSGIGVLSNSRIEVRNDAGYAALQASVGVDDSTGNIDRSVRFEVYGDGRRLAESPPLKFGDNPTLLRANIEGKRVLELVVRDDGPKNELPVVVTWGDARLTRILP
jgi:alpha-galactosidase